MTLPVMHVRPLRDVARRARDLGFELSWSTVDEGGEVFVVKLEPVSPGACAACRRVTPGGHLMAVQSSTSFPPDATRGERFDLIRQTGLEALDIAGRLMA